MNITDEFFMVGADYPGNVVAKHLQQVGDGGVVLVANQNGQVSGFVTQREIVDSFAAGGKPQDILASQIMNTDFMEVIGEETLGTILPLISERYPNNESARNAIKICEEKRTLF